MSEDFTTLQTLRFMNLQPKLSGRRRSDKKKHRTIRLEIVNFWTNSNSKTWIKDILGNKILNNHHKFGNFSTGGDWSRWNLPRVICCWIRFVMPCLLLRLLTFKLLEFPHPFQAQGTFLAGLVLMMMKRMARFSGSHVFGQKMWGNDFCGYVNIQK